MALSDASEASSSSGSPRPEALLWLWETFPLSAPGQAPGGSAAAPSPAAAAMLRAPGPRRPSSGAAAHVRAAGRGRRKRVRHGRGWEEPEPAASPPTRGGATAARGSAALTPGCSRLGLRRPGSAPRLWASPYRCAARTGERLLLREPRRRACPLRGERAAVPAAARF